MKSDAIWWLNSSAGHVKNVITVSINKTYREIAIDKWENVNMTPDVIYRNVLSQEAGLQKIRISNPLPLTIGLSDLFLRSPSSPEVEVTFDTSELEEFATQVWEVQFELNYHH